MTYRMLPAFLFALASPAIAQVVPAEQMDVKTVSLDTRPVTRMAALPMMAATTPNLIADLAEAVSPAVVNIRVTTDKGEVVSEGHGSGFIISPQGEVVTNHHVIDEGDNIKIEFNNGVSFDATIIGHDADTDLALLQIDSDQTFPTVKWNRGQAARIGEFVVPIGNPFGIGQSVSFGIISAIGRDRVDSGAYVDYIQTDATVNTGNSGGPLFNLRGEVVAVNSAIYSPTGASVGIAFAIPHKTAEDVIARLRSDGEVSRGYLGAGLRTGEYSNGLSGAVVDSMIPGGPAQLSGLQIEDIILKVNGKTVRTSVEATRAIGNIRPNSQARFRIERNEKEQDIAVRLSKRPSKAEVEQRMAGVPSSSDLTPSVPYSSGGGGTGMSLVDLSSQFRSAIGMSYDQVGVYVEGVSPGTSADAMGFKMGMVLMEFDMDPIASVSAFNDYVRKAREQGKADALVKVRLKNGTETYVSLPIVYN